MKVIKKEGNLTYINFKCKIIFREIAQIDYYSIQRARYLLYESYYGNNDFETEMEITIPFKIKLYKQEHFNYNKKYKNNFLTYTSRKQFETIIGIKELINLINTNYKLSTELPNFDIDYKNETLDNNVIIRLPKTVKINYNGKLSLLKRKIKLMNI